MNPQAANDLQKLVEPVPANGEPSERGANSQWAGAPPPRKGILGKVIFICVLVIAGMVGWRYRSNITGLFGASSAPVSGRAAGANRPIPVVGAKAVRGDMHIYLMGLGQVTPFETVTLHTRVDGQIMALHFGEGQMVTKGQTLLEIDPRPYQAQLDSAKGQLLKDQAVLDNAKIDLTRDQTAFKDGSVSDQQVATQAATVQQYEGIVETDQSAIETAQLNLVYCEVVSPMTGRIGLRLVDVGNIVHATDTTGIAVITELQPIAVIFTLPEDDLPQVVGQTNGGVGLEVDAYDRTDQTRLATGFIEAVDNEVDPTTGTFRVKAQFANKDNLLFPNQFVNAHLLVDVKHNLVLVPTAGVQHGPNGEAFVYVAKPDHTVEIRDVKEGPSEGDVTAVGGINPGEIVVTDGTDKLQDGSKVTVTFSENGPTTGPSTRPGGRSGRGGRGRSGGMTTRSSGELTTDDSGGVSQESGSTRESQ